MHSSPSLASSQYFSIMVMSRLRAWIDRQRLRDACGGFRLNQFDGEAVWKTQPVASLWHGCDAERLRGGERGLEVLAHHTQMRESSFGAFESRIVDELQSAKRPVLA